MKKKDNTKMTIKAGGKTVETDLDTLQRAAKMGRRRAAQLGLPAMEGTEGDVPMVVREMAEAWARLTLDWQSIKANADEEKKKLLTKMQELGIPAVTVVIGKWKSRIEVKTGKADLALKELGMVDDVQPIDDGSATMPAAIEGAAEAHA